jgi:hypothetical protein
MICTTSWKRKSYKNDQHDATLQENLLIHCFLTAQHVWSDIITQNMLSSQGIMD